MAETISGCVEHIRSANNTWAAVVFNTGSQKINARGNIRDPLIGQCMELTGNFVMDKQYGRQFDVKSSKVVPIRGREQIVTYLSSGFIKGVGPAVAARIYDAFGDKSLLIIENDHQRLSVVSGITEPKALAIHNSHMKNKSYMELAALLKPDITEYQIQVIYEKYKHRAIHVLRENPYQLIADLNGIGFKKADRLANMMGISGSDPRRIKACVHHMLQQEASENGHCFVTTESVEQGVLNYTGRVDMNVVAREILRSCEDGTLFVDNDDTVYLGKLYRAETQAAEGISRLLASEPVWPVPQSVVREAALEIERENGYKMDSRQIRAAINSFAYGLSVVTGQPGSGKTTLIKLLLKSWELSHRGTAYDRKSVCLASNSGKAAMRMQEVTGYPASTIHRALKIHFEGRSITYKYNDKNPLPAKLIIVDEASMIDIYLFRTLIQAIGNGSRVVFLGDIDQLAPIGPGNPFRDMVLTIRIPSEKLVISHRLAGVVEINANRINRGIGPDGWKYESGNSIFRYIPADTDATTQLAVREYLNLVSELGVNNVLLLCPSADKGTINAKIFNQLIQDHLNPRKQETQYLTVGSIEYRLGDRVIMTSNYEDWNVFNGDVGSITEITADKTMRVAFDSGITVQLPKYALNDLLLAYSITIQRSQGSEYQGAVIAVAKQHTFMLYRNLIYTAVSRANKKLTVVGDKKTLNLAVAKVNKVLRNTKLAKRIQ